MVVTAIATVGVLGREVAVAVAAVGVWGSKAKGAATTNDVGSIRRAHKLESWTCDGGRRLG